MNSTASVHITTFTHIYGQLFTFTLTICDPNLISGGAGVTKIADIARDRCSRLHLNICQHETNACFKETSGHLPELYKVVVVPQQDEKRDGCQARDCCASLHFTICKHETLGRFLLYVDYAGACGPHKLQVWPQYLRSDPCFSCYGLDSTRLFFSLGRVVKGTWYFFS